MRKILVAFLLVLNTFSGFAQKTITQRDTINLRGKVVSEDGKPLGNIGLFFSSYPLIYTGYHNSTFTDSSGNFSMNGASFNDTISIDDYNYSNPRFFNRGARYVTIHARPSRLILEDINIQARRISPRQHPLLESPVRDGEMDNEAQPQFPGGRKKFIEYISERLTYPLKAIKNNIEGTVLIGFTITANGKTENVEVINGLGYGCDEIAAAIIEGLPTWQPGAKFGRRTAVRFTVPIKFTLTD